MPALSKPTTLIALTNVTIAILVHSRIAPVISWAMLLHNIAQQRLDVPRAHEPHHQLGSRHLAVNSG